MTILNFSRYSGYIWEMRWTNLHYFLVKCTQDITYQKSLKSVNFWQSYSKIKRWTFCGHGVEASRWRQDTRRCSGKYERSLFTIFLFSDFSRFLQTAELIRTARCDKTRQLRHVGVDGVNRVGFRNWSGFLAVNLQVTWVINPAVGCHYFPPGLPLPSQPLRGLLLISLLGERRHDGCEQFAEDCYPSRLRFEPGPFCAWVQHANHSATEPANRV